MNIEKQQNTCFLDEFTINPTTVFPQSLQPSTKAWVDNPLVMASMGSIFIIFVS
jgi:hypothetical protein